MKDLISELWAQFNALDNLSKYNVLGTYSLNNTKKFLFATMDEVRLRYAASCTKEILKSTDLEDADHFRQGLLRREITRDIAYPKQRDHSAHTLYNYLMGWYVYNNATIVSNKIKEHFEIRALDGVEENFLNVWPFLSLLHDVGYLFEGGLNPLSTEIQNRQVSVGAEVAHDYFNRRFWIECGADSIYDRERIRDISDVREPDFINHSLAGVADTLRSLGDLNKLRLAVKYERAIKSEAPREPDYISKENGLLGDAFDLWQKHYEYYDLSSMVDRIKALRVTFDSLLREGFGSTGLRVLDHGVCSGLLLLLYSTFYFRVYFGLGDSPPSDENDKAVWTRFREGIHINPPTPLPEPTHEALWWWSAVVWATAATALHNVQQFNGAKQLSMDEDPLAYLGILVDCIQEWDRYTVSRESVIAGILPLQGVDVKLSSGKGKIQINYNDPDRAQKVKHSLDIALSNEWNEALTILG